MYADNEIQIFLKEICPHIDQFVAPFLQPKLTQIGKNARKKLNDDIINFDRKKLHQLIYRIFQNDEYTCELNKPKPYLLGSMHVYELLPYKKRNLGIFGYIKE